MNKLKIVNIIQIVILTAISITAVVLLFCLNPLTSTSYRVFISLLLIVNPSIHLIFLAFKLYKFPEYKSVVYTEAYCAATVVVGVLLFYVESHVGNLSEFFYLYYLGLLIPLLFLIPSYFLIKKKNKEIKKIQDDINAKINKTK